MTTGIRSDRPEEATAVKETGKIGKGRPGPGRPKGSPNKVTAKLKDAILAAATDAGGGDLSAYLRKQADERPVAFMGLLGKVLPMQVTGKNDEPVEVRVSSVRDEFMRRIEALAARCHGEPAS